MKAKHKLTWPEAVVIVVFIAGIMGFAILLMTARASVKANCDISNVMYTNVCPNNCWSSGISCEYCPLPQGFKCDIELNAPILALMGR
jgi:hypothetical protein